MSDAPEGGGGPPRLSRVNPSAPAPVGPSRGLAAPEVTAAAALAAGLVWTGPLAKDGPLRLYYLAAAAQASGLLALDTDRGRFRLHFKRGAVEHAASDAPEDDLGRFLVAKGIVHPQAVADAERVRGDFGGDLVAALASLQLVNPADSFRVLQEHGAGVVARALGAERGSASWDPAARPPASAFPLGSRWGLLCDAARRLDGLAVRKLLGDRAQRVASRAGGRVQLADLRLTALEVRAAGLFDGASSPAQLAAAYPPEGETILRVALLLGETELLAFGQQAAAPAAAKTTVNVPSSAPIATPVPTSTSTSRSTSTSAATSAATATTATRTATPVPTAGSPRPPASPAPPPRPPAPAARPSAAAAAKPAAPAAAAPKPVPKLDLATLRAFHDGLAGADHFQALGVGREATTAQIKVAYFALAKTYHPDAAPQGESPEMRQLRADVFARLGEAWGVVGDDALRAAYLQELASGGKPDVDVSAIFKAEDTFQRATVYVRTRQYDKALEALAEAMKLNADEPEFGVWKAWVDFLVAKDRKRQHAESAAVVEAALRKVPRILPGYLFLGQMAKIEGDLALAEKHFKRGLELEPDHAELVRELKYLRK